MMKFFRVRAWAGPVTIGSFFVVGATGILMFFHWNLGAVKLAHEWLGWLLVIGALAHLAVNWKASLAYLRKPVGLGIIASLMLLGVLSLLPVFAHPHGAPLMETVRALEQSPLALVAQVAKRSPQAALDALRTRGLLVRQETQTIAEIASENGLRGMEVLAYVTGVRNESHGRLNGH